LQAKKEPAPKQMKAVVPTVDMSKGSTKQASSNKIETLDELKNAYFAKMQSLNKKLENSRV